jgi:hypothetical protein
MEAVSITEFIRVPDAKKKYAKKQPGISRLLMIYRRNGF